MNFYGFCNKINISESDRHRLALGNVLLGSKLEDKGVKPFAHLSGEVSVTSNNGNVNGVKKYSIYSVFKWCEVTMYINYKTVNISELLKYLVHIEDKGSILTFVSINRPSRADTTKIWFFCSKKFSIKENLESFDIFLKKAFSELEFYDKFTITVMFDDKTELISNYNNVDVFEKFNIKEITQDRSFTLKMNLLFANVLTPEQERIVNIPFNVEKSLQKSDKFNFDVYSGIYSIKSYKKKIN